MAPNPRRRRSKGSMRAGSYNISSPTSCPGPSPRSSTVSVNYQTNDGYFSRRLASQAVMGSESGDESIEQDQFPYADMDEGIDYCSPSASPSYPYLDLDVNHEALRSVAEDGSTRPKTPVEKPLRHQKSYQKPTEAFRSKQKTPVVWEVKSPAISQRSSTRAYSRRGTASSVDEDVPPVPSLPSDLETLLHLSRPNTANGRTTFPPSSSGSCITQDEAVSSPSSNAFSTMADYVSVPSDSNESTLVALEDETKPTPTIATTEATRQDQDTWVSQKAPEVSQTKKDDLKGEYKMLKNRADQMEHDFRTKLIENKTLKQEIIALRKGLATQELSKLEYDLLYESFEELMRRNLSLEAEQSDLLDDTLKLHEALGTSQAELDALRAQQRIARDKIKQHYEENTALAVTISNLQIEMQAMRDANSNLEEMEAATKKMQDEILVMRQTVSGNRKSIEAYERTLRRTGHNGDELVSLRAHFRQLLDRYRDMLSNLVEQNQSLTHAIAIREKEMHEHEQKHRDHEDTLTKAIKQLPDNGDYEIPTENFRRLYDDTVKSNKKLEQKYNKLRAFVYSINPNLERENEELRSSLAALKDQYTRIAEEKNAWKEKSRGWEQDFQTLNEQYHQHQEQSEQKIHDLEEEMRTYIQEYHDNIPAENPDWWKIEALQRQIRKYERELDDRAAETNRAKLERDTAIEEFQKLHHAVQEGTATQYVTFVSKSETRRVPIPKFLSQEETAKRKKAVEAFRKEQRKARIDEDARERIVEEARRYHMGKRYPPHAKQYKELAEMTSWERWKVDDYLFHSAPDHVGKEAARLGRANDRFL